MTHYTFKYLKTLFPICILASQSALFSYPQSAHAASISQTAQNPALMPITLLYNALDKAEENGSTAQKRFDIIAAAVDQAFDMKTILRRSIGLHYDKLTPSERQILLQAFRRFTVASYSATFKPGAHILFSIDQTPEHNADKLTVKTTLRGSHDSASDATSVDYVMSQNAQGWRITDILLNGNMSQVAMQRSDFGSVFAQTGATGLADSLNKKADAALHD